MTAVDSGFRLRMPPPLRARLGEMAQENRRSVNSEILFHLERIAFDPLSGNALLEEHDTSVSARKEDAA